MHELFPGIWLVIHATFLLDVRHYPINIFVYLSSSTLFVTTLIAIQTLGDGRAVVKTLEASHILALSVVRH